MNGSDQSVSIIIPTRNRKEELRVALRSVLKQTVHSEVIVLDDASTDGTAEMMEEEFPEVKLVRSEKSIGGAGQRNLGTKLAKNSIVVSIDDDMEMPNSSTIEQTLKYFSHPRVWLVTIPYINVNKGPEVYQQAPDEDHISVSFRFGAGGYAVRKDNFLSLNGYRECLFMDGEELDLSIRMLEKGYVVRLGNAEPIHHFFSPKREGNERFIIKCRNHLLIPIFNVPIYCLFIHLVGTTFNNLRHGWRSKRFFLSFKGVLLGVTSIIKEWSYREPVSLRTYILFRKLRKKGSIALDDIEYLLPPIY